LNDKKRYLIEVAALAKFEKQMLIGQIKADIK
jgi:hypothetical protein